ncbi:MAG: arylsulfatase [Armatimonadaceae bacterium]
MKNVVALSSVAALPGTGEAQPSERPNLIVILADDLGYGDLGCYGQSQIPTPNLDRLAAEGTRFTDCYSGSTVCAPSRCVLLTGLHTGHCTVRGNGQEDLRPQDTTVAQILQRAGYHCACIGKWGLGAVGKSGFPQKKGFDYFFGYLGHGHAHNYYPTHLWRNDKKYPLPNVVPDEKPSGAGTATELREYAADRIAAEALTYLDSRRGQSTPFFLYYCPTLPHANNEAQREAKRGMECPDDRFYTQFASKDWPEPEKRKAAMISRLDHHVGELMARLRQNGQDKNTVLLFTSDNGPHREGGNDPDFFRSSGPFQGIKRDLYEGGIRVPLIAWGPGRVRAGTTSAHIGYFADFLPTLCDLAGLPVPSGGDGISLLPTLSGPGGPGSQRTHPYLYWEFYERGGSRAVRMGKWKGICQPWNAPLEVYDLEADPGERENLVAVQPQVASELRQALSAAHVPSPNWKLPSETPAKQKV